MTRVLPSLALVTVLLGTAIQVAAGPLEPTKPSQVVAVLGGVASPLCPNSTSNRRIDGLLKPEGGNVPFAIPAKSVLVVTSFDWRASGLTAGQNVAVGVLSSGTNGELGSVAFSSGLVDASGGAFGNGSPADRLIIKPPGTLCSLFPPGATDGLVVVHGFFAKDK